MSRQRFLLLFLGLVIPFLAACGDDPNPIKVFVTPTQQAAASISSPTAVPPRQDTATLTSTVSPPTARQALVATASPSASPTASPSPVPTGTPTPRPTVPPGVVFGPIVDQSHTLMPTEIRPTATPQPISVPTAGPSPTPGPYLRADLMGIQIHPHIDSAEYGDMLVHAQTLGVGWVKFQFNWSLLESAPGQYTEMFYMLRLYVQEAHNRGFRVMVSVAKAPDWARSPGPDGTLTEYSPPDDPQVLARFLSDLLGQYGVDVYGHPYVSAIEVWNEPNLQREWYGRPLTGTDYMRYFEPAHAAVRAFSPETVVITAAPAPTGDSEWSADDRAWLQGLYDAGLARYGQDVAIGIHPYGWANPPEARCCSSSHGWDDRPQFFFLDTVEDYWGIMTANGHTNAQLWTTEFGWATFDGLRTGDSGNGPQPGDPPGAEYFGFVDRWQQAEYTLRAFHLGQERAFMGPMILWNLNFATIPGAVDRADPQTGYALLDSRRQPRPVYRMLQQATKQP